MAEKPKITFHSEPSFSEFWMQFLDEENREIIRFYRNGRIELGEAYIARLDDAARAFWKAVYRSCPDQFGKIGEQ